jgi:7-cyano-7-deazaguanine synthase
LSSFFEEEFPLSNVKSAIVLLSGGLDSATVLAIAQAQGFKIAAMSFCYGQRHKYELKKAVDLVSLNKILRHVIVDLDLRQFGGSALTSDVAVPVDRTLEQMAHGIPLTYVPARNTVFLSYALAFAETIDCKDIFIGVNALDYAGYPDCRPEYIAAFETMANLATKAAVESSGNPIRIHTPVISMTKEQIIRKGLELGVDFANTSSCYNASEDGACGRCDACILRIQGFKTVGVKDPVPYRSNEE